MPVKSESRAGVCALAGLGLKPGNVSDARGPRDMLPGVDTSKLTPEQRMAALHNLNAESCDCGCKYTLAQCRIYDPVCNKSKERAAAIVNEAARLPAEDGAEDTAAPAPSATSGPADPPKPRTRN